VNHIDSNRMNPALENLEYVTRTENAIHAARYGRKCPLTEDDVRRIRELYAIWNFTKRVSAGNLRRRTISDIVNNWRWSESSASRAFPRWIARRVQVQWEGSPVGPSPAWRSAVAAVSHWVPPKDQYAETADHASIQLLCHVDQLVTLGHNTANHQSQ
jgi:hypothetical protein